MLDASAVLAYVQGEPGAAVVNEHLANAVLGTANLAEALARMPGDVERRMMTAILLAQGVRIEPVTEADAWTATRLHDENRALSLGDRLCLALAERLDVSVLTADKAWGDKGRVQQIR